MAKDVLGDPRLHLDELNKLRALDPADRRAQGRARGLCGEKNGQFQKRVGGLIELVDQLAKEAENEKMKVIGAQNLLRSRAKQREAQSSNFKH
ncbi:intraflagellar transport protein 20 homolog [Fukomys damarensis]|uniref:intraflagellar transport protein 20 homolog n=1 Tax=Fukomys damarensis TaxID=885580 RepID=UPI0014553570|nr:intraflagellar transport protein 20 homolog [Fukomys damarensis]